MLLNDNEIHVWVWRCSPIAIQNSHLAVLSDVERARAARFVFERDRARFTIAYAGLRQVLGSLLGIAPAAITLTTDARGKPRLTGSTRPPVFFNLSHSHDLAALAVSSAFEVGLDIEYIREIDLDDVIAFLSQTEQTALMRLPPGPTRRLGIFNAWTRKEAYLKAIGFGITVPLDSFDVSLMPDEPARILRIAGSMTEARAWQLTSVTPASGYVGAVAARALGWHVTCDVLEFAT